jgi:spore germination protein
MIIHVVSSGETLWQIAKSYEVNMNSIASINELQNSNQLMIGQSLVIPKPGTIHVVKYGETLWSIAQKYGVTINAISHATKLTNQNLIYPGTTLFIPPITHVVQTGEMLWQIANRYGTTVQAIIRENQIENPNLIHSGMQLVIPRVKPTIEANAYTYQSGEEAAKSINEVGHLLTYFSPFAYIIMENGALQPMKDVVMIDAAISKNVVPMMSITNFTSTQAGSNLAHTILASPEIREKVITSILQVMDEKKYKGLNIDFENVLPADRLLYNQFLQQAVDRLHPDISCQRHLHQKRVLPKRVSYMKHMITRHMEELPTLWC